MKEVSLKGIERSPLPFLHPPFVKGGMGGFLKIGILTIGNEITSGRIQDTNTAYLAREFHVRGWEVAAVMSVGDSISAIRDALDCILSVSDGVVVTGGLGPTADDITTEAITEIYGLALHR